jgi:hypothetical protein
MDFRVKCAESDIPWFTKGNIYKVENGELYDNGAKRYSGNQFSNVGDINKYIESWGLSTKFELVKDNMKKEDLKVGYVVETRSEEFRMIIETGEGIVLAANGSCINIDKYTNGLANSAFSKHDVVRVYGLTNWPTQALRLSACGRPLLWERKPEFTEVTLEEIANWKGVPVENVRVKE